MNFHDLFLDHNHIIFLAACLYLHGDVGNDFPDLKNKWMDPWQLIFNSIKIELLSKYLINHITLLETY